MYEIFEKLCDEYGVTPYKVSKETGISRTALSDWKTGKYALKLDKLQKIADFFNVSVEYLTTGEQPKDYYLNDETAQIAQEIFDDPNLRALFSAARGVKPEQMKLAEQMLKQFKETNPDA